MKSIFFHFQGYRSLPDDFNDRYDSIYVTPPNRELCDPEVQHREFHWNLDELEYADELGFDGLGVNEHHQNGYGYCNSPNLIAFHLARRKSKAAIVTMGATLPMYNPPIRVAEEFAMIDVLSGGRLVAGLPVGTPMDNCLCYGITPTEVRPRYYEAHDLIKQAWTRPGPFSFNGRFSKLRYVNPWPLPYQRNPHPPIWLAGGGSMETWSFAAQNNYTYNYLSFLGHGFAEDMMKGYWDVADQHGLDRNPYRAGFAQVVVVGETDAEAERLYTPHLKYFYETALNTAPWQAAIPGYSSTKSIKNLMAKAPNGGYGAHRGHKATWGDLIDKGIVIGGGPETVVQQLEAAMRKLNAGHLICLMQVGSMDNELTRHCMKLFAEKVLPKVRPLWDKEGWKDHWWPTGAVQDASAPVPELVEA